MGSAQPGQALPLGPALALIAGLAAVVLLLGALLTPGIPSIVVGEAIRVAADASALDCEAARLAVQDGLDDVHRRAYALVGSKDPGAREAISP